MRKDIGDRRDDIERGIHEERTKIYMCQQLNCRPATLDSWLRRMDLSYQGKQIRFGHIAPNRKDVSEYLVEGRLISGHRLKTLLLRDGLKSHCCENCGRTKWLGQAIPLELHHIDGNRGNNKHDNLQLLCANCHALTPNNSGKGIKRH